MAQAGGGQNVAGSFGIRLSEMTIEPMPQKPQQRRRGGGPPGDEFALETQEFSHQGIVLGLVSCIIRVTAFAHELLLVHEVRANVFQQPVQDAGVDGMVRSGAWSGVKFRRQAKELLVLPVDFIQVKRVTIRPLKHSIMIGGNQVRL